MLRGRTLAGDATLLCSTLHHPRVESRANLKSISHRFHLFELAFVWELTKETINLLLGCLQGGPVTWVHTRRSGKASGRCAGPES